MAIEPNLGIHQKHSYPSSSYKVEYLSNEKGTIEILFCKVCGYSPTAMCEHTKNSWNEEGTKLTCDLCGADGT